VTFDFFAEYECVSREKIKEVTDGEIIPSEKITILATGLANPNLKELVRLHYQELVCKKAHLNKEISQRVEDIKEIGIINTPPNLEKYPTGSFFVFFKFILEKPFISRDDIPFYIIENPVRKDKVFKVPVVSAAAWKGNLRWIIQKIFLQDCHEDFAEERFRHSLLFGTEKGMEEEGLKSWAKFLKDLNPEADNVYRHKLVEHFYPNLPLDKKPEPHLIKIKGRLNFYPTFFNQIDLTVINPHDRKTKTGKNPILIECVPAGTEGVFSLLYVPFDLIGKDENRIKMETKLDLERVLQGIKAMFLTYGFSAKKNSGFGVAKDEIEGMVIANMAVNPDFEKAGDVFQYRIGKLSTLGVGNYE
jgi:CRISPR-associated protein Cmr2